MKGQTVCMIHGGKAPQALAKAQAAMKLADMRLRGLTTVAVDTLERLLRADSEARSSKLGKSLPPDPIRV